MNNGTNYCLMFVTFMMTMILIACIFIFIFISFVLYCVAIHIEMYTIYVIVGAFEMMMLMFSVWIAVGISAFWFTTTWLVKRNPCFSTNEHEYVFQFNFTANVAAACSQFPCNSLFNLIEFFYVRCITLISFAWNARFWYKHADA